MKIIEIKYTLKKLFLLIESLTNDLYKSKLRDKCTLNINKELMRCFSMQRDLDIYKILNSFAFEILCICLMSFYFENSEMKMMPIFHSMQAVDVETHI